MKHKKRVTALVLAALMLFGVMEVIRPGTSANAVTQAEIDALQSQRDTIRSQKKDIQEQIDALQSEMASVIAKKAALDEQNELNRQDIELINEQIALYDELIAEKGREVENAIRAEEDQFARYCARVRAMEETNKWSYVSFLFESEGLMDFLGRLNDVLDIVNNDRHVKDEYIAAREYVEQVKAEYEAVQAQQQLKREELLAEKKRLEAQIEAAYTMIADLEQDIEAYKIAYEENEALEGDIQAKIDAKVEELRKQKAAEEAARKAWEESQRRAQQQAQQQAQAQQQQQQRQQQSKPVASGAGYFSWPVGTTYITSAFGYRIHPIFGTTKYHSGVDIGAGAGVAIGAAAGGTVQIAEKSDSYGYYCVIYHSNGLTTLYAHMNAMPAVSVGQTVSAGQTIGYVGSTGWSTAPHLHFEIRSNGSCVDPISYFPGISFSYAPDA